MTYKIKNGKMVHNQKRVNDFARHIRATCQQISGEELIEAVTDGGRVIHAMHAHEQWCETIRTGRGADCTCKPDVTFYKEPSLQ